MKRRPAETFHGYNERTGRWLDKIRADNSMPYLHHLVITKVFQAAWREKAWRENTNENYFESIREYKSEQWWVGLRDLVFRSIKLAPAVHGRQGP